MHETEDHEESSEYEQSSNTVCHANIHEVLGLEESNTDVAMQEQESIEDNLSVCYSEDNSSNFNDINSSLENTSVSTEETSESGEFDINIYLRVALTEWTSHGISKRKINSLLRILNKVHPELPKTYVTLLNTPKTMTVFEIDNGHVWYKGVKKILIFFYSRIFRYL